MSNNLNKPFLEIPAIRVSQPIGEFFLCAIPAKKLQAISYSIPAKIQRENGAFSRLFGNQRLKLAPRAKQIGEYIDEEYSTFPNTIILSANYNKDLAYEADESIRWHAVRKDDGSYTLIIPTDAPLASIIDGQHRIGGFDHVHKESRLSMDLPCAVYINLPREYQAKIFATININQKRVDKSLAYQLFGHDLNSSDAGLWPPDMLGVYLARVFEGKKGSPFEKRIKLALVEEDNVIDAERGKEDNVEGKWKVSVACIVEGVTRLISDKPILDRSKLAQGQIDTRAELGLDNAPLRDLYIRQQDKSILEIINDYFLVIDEKLWSSQKKRSLLTRTVGILALFDVLRDGLISGKIKRDDVQRSTTQLFEPVHGFDFSDDFFQASGAGRVRIRNVLKYLIGLGSATDSEVVSAAERLAQSVKR